MNKISFKRTSNITLHIQLNYLELINAITYRKMNISGQNPEPDEIEEMVDEADADGSGSINFPEFIELMLKKQAGSQTKDEIKQVIMTNPYRTSLFIKIISPFKFRALHVNN